MASKIEDSLTPEQLREFLQRALQLRGTKLKDIKALAAEFDIEISLMSAKTFRDGKFSEHLEKIERAKNQIEQLKQVMADGTDTIDASLKIAAAELLDKMTNGEEVDLVEISKIIQRLMTSRARKEIVDQNAAKLVEERQEREESRAKAKAALTEVKKRGGLTKESLAKIEEAAKLL